MKKGRLGSIFMFGVACITSPCCTPLIVPLVIALLAGTPVALWMGANLGWVYGALTVISIISFVVALRRIGGREKPQPTPIRPVDIPVIAATRGENIHVQQSK
jgi:hypothetical protein